MPESSWKTAIAKIEPNKILVRGYPIDQLMGKASFGQMVYLLFKGELPTLKQGRMIEVILTSSVDHGVTPPSILSALTVTTTGAELSSAIAAGILSISKFHGGAIEDCMYLLKDTIELMAKKSLSTTQAAKEIIISYKEEGKKLSGFGHRLHTDDPRTKKLFDLAEEYGISGKYISIAQSIKNMLEENLGKKLPINVDGAIAAVLCEMNFDPQIANALFMIARLPGMVAHIIEERTRQRPMRKIDPSNYEYDGPAERPVPDNL
jgi:citrate synthase